MRHAHEVIFAPQSLVDLDALYVHISVDSSTRADAFLSLLQRKIESLRVLPDRHPRAREGTTLGVPVRQFTVRSYRVLYAVQGRTVYILRVGHGARRTLELD